MRLLLLVLAGCGPTTPTTPDGGDGGVGTEDGGSADGGPADGGSADGGPADGGGDEARYCELATDLADPWFLEGEAVAFEVYCGGEFDTEHASFTALDLPDGATFDGATRRFAWQTGPADGGRVDVHFSVARGGTDTVPSAEVVTFWVADNPSEDTNVPVDPLTYTEEWGLPVVHLRPREAIGQRYGPARVTWRGVAYEGEIMVRGAASSSYPKPSYALDFDTVEPEIPEWGETREHLVLLSTFDDNSYVRQKLVYDLWRAMAAYWTVDRLTPRAFFVVVYMDRSYWGLYLMLDHVDAEFVRHMGLDGRGSLYKAVDHNANFYATDVYGYPKVTLHDGYEQVEGTSFADLDALVDFTANASDETLLADASRWLRLDEFMDWYLLVHYTASDDSGGKNAYLYSGPEGNAIRYVPWDFNHSWGQDWLTGRQAPGMLDDFTWANRVFLAIQNVSWSNEAQWDRFAAMREEGPFAADWIVDQLDRYYAAIEPSAERDWAKWGSSYRTYPGWATYRDGSGDWTTYPQERAYLYRWVEERAALFEALHP